MYDQVFNSARILDDTGATLFEGRVIAWGSPDGDDWGGLVVGELDQELPFETGRAYKLDLGPNSAGITFEEVAARATSSGVVSRGSFLGSGERPFELASDEEAD
jgi:hypothetical protein